MPKIWPNFEQAFAFDAFGGEALSSLFVILLWAMAILSLLYAVFSWRRCVRRQHFYDDLLAGMSEAQLLERRNLLRETAAEAGRDGEGCPNGTLLVTVLSWFLSPFSSSIAPKL